MGEHKQEREVRDRVSRVAEPVVYRANCCGSCHWRREKMLFGRFSQICVVMPKQVIAVAQSQGAQIVSVNPVIEDLATETCAMWKPLEGDTQ